MKSEVNYLGHAMSEEGVKTEPDKVESLKSWPIPKDVKDVRAILEFSGYYRRFIRNHASIARYFSDLLIGRCTNTKRKKKRKLRVKPLNGRTGSNRPLIC